MSNEPAMRPPGIWAFSSGSRCKARMRSTLSIRSPGRTGQPSVLVSLATPLSASIKALLKSVGPVANPAAYLPNDVEQITHCFLGSPWSSPRRFRAISLFPIVSSHGSSVEVGFRQQSNRSN